MPGDVDDAPRLLEQRIDDLACGRTGLRGILADQIDDARAPHRRVRQPRTASASLRAPSSLRIFRRARRALQSRAHWPRDWRRTTRSRNSLMRSLRSSLTRIAHGSVVVALAAWCRAAPTESSPSAGPARSASRRFRRQIRLELHRDEQIEQRPADLLIAILIVRRGRNKLAVSSWLCARCPRTSLRARLVSSVYEIIGVPSLSVFASTEMKSNSAPR